MCSGIDDKVLRFVKDINNGDIKGTYNIVIATVAILKEIIINAEWSTAQELMSLVKANGRYLKESLPLEESIGNMVKRVLHIIREESDTSAKLPDTRLQDSLHKFVTSSDRDDNLNEPLPSLKASVVEHIGEFEVELEICSENITSQASEHIHSNEIVMTIGYSKLVEEFFNKAAETRAFEVIVAEGGPLLPGHEMAVNLSKSKIKTTLISDVAIFAMMSRVNKVIIGTHTAMANGGLRAISGSHIVAQAAKHYSVPVMVLLPLYKLSPMYACSYEQNAFNKQIAPTNGVIDGANEALMERIQAYNPLFDYVPPELVTLFISNTGGNAPSYVYRLLSELYHANDYDL